MVQLSHPYMTTGKTIAWTRWTFVGKVMSLFNNDTKLPLTLLKGSEEGPRCNECAGMVGMHPPPFPKHTVKHI